KRVFLVILFTSFSGSLVSRISGAVQVHLLTGHRDKFNAEKCSIEFINFSPASGLSGCHAQNIWL
ncbi:hypothetical protein, partial [Escherichia coli]